MSAWFGAGVGAILGATAGLLLVTAGWLTESADAAFWAVIPAAQCHAVLTTSLTLGAHDADLTGRTRGWLTDLTTAIPKSILVGFIGLFYYALAIAWGLALGWGLWRLFGDNGLLASFDELPWALQYLAKLAVGGLCAGAWALFGCLFLWPVFIEDAEGPWKLLAEGIVVLLLGGAISVPVALCVVVSGFLIHNVAGFALPSIHGIASASLAGSLYGVLQGYVLGRYLR
jgi:hypothetical protein